jgi:uncharacterized protein YbjT (DUF2867 family)
MKSYIEVRAACEAIIRDSGLSATILRPWYVLGPGHRWPIVLKPVYWLLESLPATAAGARRLGLVSLDDILQAMTWAIEHPPETVRILGVEDIRRISNTSLTSSEALCHL